MIWSDPLVTYLRKMATLGRSNAEIAERLGISKGAVAGARFRYGLAVPRKPRPSEPEPIVPPPAPWPSPFECRFIANKDPRHPQWCLERTVPDSPYCPEHHARCYTTTIRQWEAPAHGTTSDD